MATHQDLTLPVNFSAPMSLQPDPDPDPDPNLTQDLTPILTLTLKP